MKTIYTTRFNIARCAIADVSEIFSEDKYERCCTLNRINVPPEFRGKGHGSRLLQRVLDDADEEDVIVMLGINPYGEMTYDQLRDWYERHGFVEEDRGSGSIFIRQPQ